MFRHESIFVEIMQFLHLYATILLLFTFSTRHNQYFSRSLIDLRDDSIPTLTVDYKVSAGTRLNILAPTHKSKKPTDPETKQSSSPNSDKYKFSFSLLIRQVTRFRKHVI